MSARTLLFVLAGALFPGCGQYLVAPHPLFPTSRTFAAGFDRVWEATLESLEGMPLASVDRASGFVITDRVRAPSDHRYYSAFGRPPRSLEARFKLTVRVRPVEGGTSVKVDLYEETNYPRTVALSAPSRRGLWGAGRHRERRGPSTAFDWEGAESFALDDWIPTASSTMREHALLEEIRSILARGR